MLNEIKPAGKILNDIWEEFIIEKKRFVEMDFQ